VSSVGKKLSRIVKWQREFRVERGKPLAYRLLKPILSRRRFNCANSGMAQLPMGLFGKPEAYRKGCGKPRLRDRTFVQTGRRQLFANFFKAH
jgi:hypothetical protein